MEVEAVVEGEEADVVVSVVVSVVAAEEVVVVVVALEEAVGVVDEVVQEVEEAEEVAVDVGVVAEEAVREVASKEERPLLLSHIVMKEFSLPVERKMH